jgi:hypothetical protein
MSGPYIHISTYTIKSGKLDEATMAVRELVDLVETNEPRLISFNVYLDEQGTKLSVVQVHPDADSMEWHMKVISEHLTSSFEYLGSTVSEQAFGEATAPLSSTLRQWAEPGVPVTFMPAHAAGFTRTDAR